MRRTPSLIALAAVLFSVSAASAATRQPMRANKSTAVPAAPAGVAAFNAAAELTSRARPIAPDMTRGIDALRIRGSGGARHPLASPGLARPFP